LVVLPKTLGIVSVLFFGALFVELISLRQIAIHDLQVYDWIQEYRSCALDRVGSFLNYWTTTPYGTIALILSASGWLGFRGRWQDLGRFAVIVIGGALLSAWIKEFVSRPRPSALSFVEYGSNFPSGHVTSASTIFGSAYYFLCTPATTKRWKKLFGVSVVSLLILIVGFQRIYFTHHWLSDVVGGILLGTGWFFFTIHRFASRVSARSVIAVAGVFACAFLALRLLPGWRVNGPIPMAWRGDSTRPIDLSVYTPNTVLKRERSLGAGRSPETIWHFFKVTTTIDLTLERGNEYIFFWGGAARPRVPLASAGCRKIGFVFNDRPVKTLVLYNGWRDYRISLGGDLGNPIHEPD
jgi:membrane-associated phospholipid phosphatase